MDRKGHNQNTSGHTCGESSASMRCQDPLLPIKKNIGQKVSQPQHIRAHMW